MEKNDLERAISIAYVFLEKSCIQEEEVSYSKMQCIIYQANKAYYHYKNELLYEINTITSNRYPIHMDILREFSSFRDKMYISYIPGSQVVRVNLHKSILLDYIWYKYGIMKDEELIACTLQDKLFVNKSGFNITEDCIRNEEKDESVEKFMDFLLK